MPIDPGFTGLSSGIDTGKIVDKLVEVESRPVKRLENEIKERQMEKEAWTKISESLKKIESSARTLYSFNSPFGFKLAKTDAPDLLLVTADKYAEIMTHDIKIMQVAARHKIASDAIDRDYKIPAGAIGIKVGIIEKKIYFNGGNINNLFELLSEKGKVVSASLINKDKKNFVLTLESKTWGEEGAIDLDDEKGILKDIGFKKIWTSGIEPWNLELAKIAAGNNKEPELSYYNLSNSAEGENIWFWTEKKRDLYNGEAPQKSSEIDKSKDLPKDQEKTILSLKGKTHLGFPVKNYTVSDSTQLILEFSPDYIKDISDYQPKPTALRAQDILEKEGERSVTISRKKKLAIGGIILETRDLVRNEKDFDTLRELELRKSLAQKKVNTKKSPQKTSENDLRVRGTIRLIFDDGSHKEIIYHASNFKRSLKTREPNIQLRENLLPFTGKTIKALEIKNDAGVVSIHSLKLEPRKKGKIFKYKNEINAAQDAVLHFGGVEIYRSSNDSLTDIIKGLKLTLLNSSTKNIKIDVRVDTETPRKAIEKFLESYNNFLELAGFYQKVEKEEEAGNFKRQKEKSGILVGDSTLARLVSDLKMMLTNPYPGTSDKAIRIFFHIGIATGKLRQSFEEIQKGQMKIIDDNKLEDQLANNYEEVKNFFGLDTTGDRKIDQGLAFKINNYLSNYTRSGRLGLIAAKLQLSDDRIKNLKETKERKLAHVENYREKLKRSFATMEQGMMRTKKEQQWLNNQMKGMGGDK